MSARGWLFGVWALAAASAVTWGLKIGARPLPVPAAAALAQGTDAPRGDWSRVLGADAPAPVSPVAAAVVADPRFVLVGVITPRRAGAGGEGLALIAVDDRPARAFRVGAVVDGGRVLQSVGPRSATIGAGGGAAPLSLSLPPVAEAARGVPTAGGAVPRAFPGAPPAAAVAPVFPGAPATAASPRPLTAPPTSGYQPPGLELARIPPPGVPPPVSWPNPSDAARPAAPSGAVDANGAALR